MNVRRGLVSIPAAAVLAAGLLVAATAPAAAQSPSPNDGLDRNDQIVLNGRLIVPKDASVGTAAIVNGPAVIAGTVQETVFVLHGRADISGTVQRDVVVIDGTVVVRSGAHIGGDVVSRTPPQIEKGATVDGRLRSVAARFDTDRLGVASRIAWWVLFSVSSLVLGLVLLLLFPGLDAAVTRAWSGRRGGAVGFGAAAFFLLPVVAVVLLVTVVGIPLGLFLLLALALLYTVGYVAGALVVGRLILRPPRSRYLAFLVGWVILRLVALVPILGGLAFLVVAVIGLGALVVAARRAPAAEAPAPPPPPPPVPATA